MFPINEVRQQFPALGRIHNGRKAAYFDGPGGTQFISGAIDAMRDYMTKGAANLHGDFPTSRETEEMLAATRRDICELFNARNCSVAFGPNATTLMFHASRALARSWQRGDEIILTELDHHANIDTWRTAAADKGVTVKFIPLDTSTLTLNMNALQGLITPKTKLIAVGIASNCVGTITDIRPVVRLAKEAGALVAVDAVHATPHFYVDMRELGIDMLFSSAYKFFSSHVGMAVIRDEIFEKLDIYKLIPAPDYIPDRMEIGTQNHEGIAGISASIQFITNLGNGSIKEGYKAIEEHENKLADTIRQELAKINGITLYQAASDVPKTPTIAFRAANIPNQLFCKRMCDEHGVFIAHGHFYALTLAEKLGILESGSFIRAGLAPYNTMSEVERFIAGVQAIIGG